MGVVWLIPAGVSFLVLAAHFLRAGNLLLVAMCLGLMFFVMLARGNWARRVVQVLLVLGAVEWMRTLMGLVQERNAAGVPWTAAAIILGSVAAVCVIAALMMETRQVRQRFVRAAA